MVISPKRLCLQLMLRRSCWLSCRLKTLMRDLYYTDNLFTIIIIFFQSTFQYLHRGQNLVRRFICTSVIRKLFFSEFKVSRWQRGENVA